MNALEVLESHQQQIDGTGGMVGVSRQALDELIADYKQVSINLGATEEAFTDFRGKVAGKVCGLCDIHERAYCYANTEKLETRITELEKEQSNLEIPYFLRQPGAVEEDVRKHIDELKQKLSEYDNAFQDMRDICDKWKMPQKFPGLARSRFLKGRQIAIEEDGDEIIHLPEKCVLWACEFSGKNIKLIKGKDGDWVCPNCGYSYGEPEE